MKRNLSVTECLQSHVTVVEGGRDVSIILLYFSMQLARGITGKQAQGYDSKWQVLRGEML